MLAQKAEIASVEIATTGVVVAVLTLTFAVVPVHDGLLGRGT
jgi:hypothetical protein